MLETMVANASNSRLVSILAEYRTIKELTEQQQNVWNVVTTELDARGVPISEQY